MPRIYQTIDAHAAGEPLRIIVSGVPTVKGATMLERRRYFRDQLDHIRTTVMLEPRGHADMYGCVTTPPVSADADMGVLFMHNEGYSTMCGHGVIALVTVAVENGWVRDPASVVLDTPAGKVRARAHMDGRRVERVSFENVPAFVFRNNLEVLGMSVDVVFGGAFYAIVEPSPVPLDREHLGELRDLGMQVKGEITRTFSVVHPEEPDVEGIYGTIFCGPAKGEGRSARNVTVFADAQVDRSPCGTGTAAVIALRSAQGRLEDGQDFVHEGIANTVFEGRVLGRTRVSEFDAVLTEICGSAYVTGYHTLVVDDDDPLKNGFRT